MKTRLGHYEIVAELGRGGMGVVYKGYEPSLARYVAIKELSPALAHDEVVVERFLREARAMAKLNDPHIIQIYSIGQEDDQPFFVMEFVDGASIADLIKRDGVIQCADAMKIVHQAAQGLLTAHGHGVIHRDIKPANMILSMRGQIKIADFGIALANHDLQQTKLTSQGDFVGTPGYLAPEALLGKKVDQRSDVYALGVVLFEMLTGRKPFTNSGVYQLMLDSVQTEVPDVREFNAGVDPAVAGIAAKMLHKDPAERHQSMDELLADLESSPLIARGGPLQIKATAPASSDATIHASSSAAVTPGAMAQVRKPLKVSSLPISSSSNRSEASVNIDTPKPADVQHKFVEEFLEGPQSQSTSQRPRSSRKLIYAALIILPLIVIGLWLANSTGEQANDVIASSASSSVKMENAKSHLFDIYADAKSMGVSVIKPLLNKINLPLPAGLLFDLIMLLIGAGLVKTAVSSVIRRLTRKKVAWSPGAAKS